MKHNRWLAMVVLLFVVMNCSKSDSSGGGTAPTPVISLIGQITTFGETDVLSHSDSQNIEVKGTDLTNNLQVEASQNFEVSLDDVTFTNSVSIEKSIANAGNSTVYVRFSPLEASIGNMQGTLTFQSSGATTKTMNISGVGLSIEPVIAVNQTALTFDDTQMSSTSQPKLLIVNGDNLVDDITLSTADAFEISLDGTTYSNSLQINAASANEANTVYVRFAPTEIGNATGTLTLQNLLTQDVTVSLAGNGIPIIHNYPTFDHERLAFGGGYNQSSTQTFNLPTDLSNIATIKMYVKLTCPSGGCDEWDVYANVKVIDPSSGELYELGRYITPY